MPDLHPPINGRRAWLLPAFFLCLLIPAIGFAASADPLVATFSIAAADPDTGEVGVAVASRFFIVGNVVPWAKAGVARRARSDLLPEVLYDLAVIRRSNGKMKAALADAVAANPKLTASARKDDDLAPLRSMKGFEQAISKGSVNPERD